jgi:hypothetical protein
MPKPKHGNREKHKQEKVAERKLTREVITHLRETRERILRGRDLKSDSTETLRRFRDGGMDGTIVPGESQPPSQR